MKYKYYSIHKMICVHYFSFIICSYNNYLIIYDILDESWRGKLFKGSGVCERREIRN